MTRSSFVYGDSVLPLERYLHAIRTVAVGQEIGAASGIPSGTVEHLFPVDGDR